MTKGVIQRVPHAEQQIIVEKNRKMKEAKSHLLVCCACRPCLVSLPVPLFLRYRPNRKSKFQPSPNMEPISQSNTTLITPFPASSPPPHQNSFRPSHYTPSLHSRVLIDKMTAQERTDTPSISVFISSVQNR